MALGGASPLGEQTTGQRALWGTQAVLNSLGLVGVIYDGAASTAGKGVIVESNTAGKVQLPSWYRTRLPATTCTPTELKSIRRRCMELFGRSSGGS